MIRQYDKLPVPHDTAPNLAPAGNPARSANQHSGLFGLCGLKIVPGIDPRLVGGVCNPNVCQLQYTSPSRVEGGDQIRTATVLAASGDSADWKHTSP